VCAARAQLILNTVALEFVLKIDDTIFESLAPIRTKNVITRVAPLNCTSARMYSCRGLDVTAALSAIVVSAATFFYVVVLLNPQTHLLMDARSVASQHHTSRTCSRAVLTVWCVAWCCGQRRALRREH
jgi:hypothetical protein